MTKFKNTFLPILGKVQIFPKSALANFEPLMFSNLKHILKSNEQTPRTVLWTDK